MLIPPQRPPIILKPKSTANPMHAIVTTPDGRRMTLCCAIYRGETMHHDRFRSLR